ncbi:carbohydrate-binding family 9-like protein [Flavobacterium sp.]|uniref:carbohydrate-binding family 9-like protein n=1 Tax=Flavobacterium sp. TaxID=239 RepID=UPI002CA79D7B|nr:carbohydrate-binding family 9-like protein [Flavobacterium sp.]HSD05686.1 carbohydrate-binding family 9-like protein [Flavobacterium sp.]
MKSNLILCFLFFSFWLTSYSQVIPIHKISEKVSIDGDLSEWEMSFLGPFVIHNSGAKATQQTFVSFSWDEKNLYIAYRSEDSKIIGSNQGQDSHIYKTDDLVEVFIDPDGDGQNYVEIGVNAFSTNYDLLIECISANCGGWKTSTAFTVIGMETVSKINSEGFSTEIKIPFSSLESIKNGNFIIPKIGTKWKGNAFRIDYGMKTTEYLSLQPYRSSKFGFHQPKEFADFEFVD